jgi:hypothetical protein
VRDPDPAVAELQKFEAPRLVRIRIGFNNREGSKPPDTRLLLFVISGETVTPASQELTDRFDRKWGAD